jgi:ribosome biogenesis GTPase
MPEKRLALEALGWNGALEEAFRPYRAKGLEPGRVAVEDKHYYVVLTPGGELTGQIPGKLLHTTQAVSELPKVGDWVAVAPLPSESKAIIHHVLRRRTKLSRKVPGREMEEQVLATNIDLAFVVQALDTTFKPSLLQRHLLMVREGGARAAVVLNKADLCADRAQQVALGKSVAGEAPIIVVSAKTGEGLASLIQLIHPAETVVFIGASGVGKSSLINDLYGEEVQATTEVRERDAKGRHTTTWRELIQLPNGGLVIDTPGMREFQLWTAHEGLRESFADLEELTNRCHFPACTHTVEGRCAVLEALQSGQLPRERYDKFLKLQKELAYLDEAHTKHAWLQRKRQGRSAHRGFKGK